MRNTYTLTSAVARPTAGGHRSIALPADARLELFIAERVDHAIHQRVPGFFQELSSKKLSTGR
jgi:hypothetical protein